MHLYVMRHGPAEDRAPTGRDADRPLTAEGRARVQRVSRELHRLRGGVPLPRALVSPLVRARETGAIVTAICGAPEAEVRDELTLDAELPLALTSELAQRGEDVLLVGHQPGVEHLVRTLVADAGHGARGLLSAGFCTALIAALEAGIEGAQGADRQPGAPSAGLQPPGRSTAVWSLRHVLDPRVMGG